MRAILPALPLVIFGLSACGDGAGSSRDAMIDIDPDGTLSFRDARADGSDPVDASAVADGRSDQLAPFETFAPGPRCATAPSLDLTDGRRLVHGSTAGLDGEFADLTCGLSQPWGGPQGYYRLAMQAGQAYRITVTARFSGYLYLFSAAANCDQDQIESDCSSAGLSGGVSSRFNVGVPNSWVFQPQTSEVYLLAIEGATEEEGGLFALEVETFSPPANGRCEDLVALQLTNRSVTVEGTTEATANEFTDLRCDGLPLAGPQVYYSVPMVAGRRYQLTIEAEFFARLVVFSAAANCDKAAIETDCSSGGDSGLIDHSALPNRAVSAFFVPAVDGTYVIAVDAAVAHHQGRFTLRVEESDLPGNGRCADAVRLNPSGGTTTIRGNSGGVGNEFVDLACGGETASGRTDLSGPQLYYRWQAEADKTYRIALEPSFRADLFVFSAAAACDQAAIEADCQSAGASGATLSYLPGGEYREIYFSPQNAGDYLVAVDSPGAGGDFALSLGEYAAAPQNAACASAQLLGFNGGIARVEGNTALASSDLAGLSCGLSGGPRFDGPQLYYRIPLSAGQGYLFTLRPSFSATMALFPASTACDADAVEAACSSDGVSGAAKSVGPSSGELIFRPQTSGDYVLVVDGGSATTQGSFTLEIAEQALPANDRCASAQVVALSSNPLFLSDDTAQSTDEFSEIDCGELTFEADGPQLYYRVTLTGGRQYTITLLPQFNGALYAFVAETSCDGTAIDAACENPVPATPEQIYHSEADPIGSGGGGGGCGSAGGFMLPSEPEPPLAETLRIKPAATSDWIVVVDAANGWSYGPFTLAIAWQ